MRIGAAKSSVTVAVPVPVTVPAPVPVPGRHPFPAGTRSRSCSRSRSPSCSRPAPVPAPIPVPPLPLTRPAGSHPGHRAAIASASTLCAALRPCASPRRRVATSPHRHGALPRAARLPRRRAPRQRSAQDKCRRSLLQDRHLPRRLSPDRPTRPRTGRHPVFGWPKFTRSPACAQIQANRPNRTTPASPQTVPYAGTVHLDACGATTLCAPVLPESASTPKRSPAGHPACPWAGPNSPSPVDSRKSWPTETS